MGAIAGSLIGLAGSSMQAGATKKAAAQMLAAGNQTAQEMQGYAAPYQAEGAWALPMQRGYIQSEILPRVGQNDPYLLASHRQNLAGIGRSEQHALASSKRYWGMTGNVGRSRGEQLRIMAQWTEARNRENLGYGQAQTAYKRQSLGDAMSALGNEVSLGQFGVQMAAEGSRSRMAGAQAAAGYQSQSPMGGFLGELGGTMAGYGLMNRAMKKRPTIDPDVEYWRMFTPG
jgi:hypothetical protein